MCVSLSIANIITEINLIVSNATDDQIDGVIDRFHDWSAPINRYLADNPSRKDALLILSSSAIDLLIIVQGMRLLARGTTFRFIFATIAFFGIR